MSQPNIKHLEFIQAVITRMNTNSFQIKGWAITIVAALLAVFASTKNKLFILVSLFPVVVFWFFGCLLFDAGKKVSGIIQRRSWRFRKPQRHKGVRNAP